MEIRSLKTKDFFTVAAILGKMTGDAAKEIGSAGQNATAIGAAFLSKAFQYAEHDLKKWLADIAQITVEAFDDLPYHAPIDIIEKLADKENLKDFFSRVVQLKEKFTK